jgi:hypothetical protein
MAFIPQMIVTATTYPDRYRPDLARALTNLGVTLSKLSRLDDAKQVQREAERIRADPAIEGRSVGWALGGVGFVLCGRVSVLLVPGGWIGLRRLGRG